MAALQNDVGGKVVRLPSDFQLFEKAEMHPAIAAYERNVLHHNDLSDGDFEALRQLLQAMYERYENE